eukprot:9451044-Alexandrium_andersonii.AAC.1
MFIVVCPCPPPPRTAQNCAELQRRTCVVHRRRALVLAMRMSVASRTRMHLPLTTEVDKSCTPTR